MSPLGRPTLVLDHLRPTRLVAPPGMLFGQLRAFIKRLSGSRQNGRQLSGVFPRMLRRTFSIGRCTVGFLLVHRLDNCPKGRWPEAHDGFRAAQPGRQVRDDAAVFRGRLASAANYRAGAPFWRQLLGGAISSSAAG
jgi:hypothetical protein